VRPDIGYISASTRIRSDASTWIPCWCAAVLFPAVNRYRALPRYTPEESIPFAGHEQWNDRPGVAPIGAPQDEAPIDTTRRMIERLREGSVAR